MKMTFLPALTSVLTLLSVACATPSMAQTPSVGPAPIALVATAPAKLLAPMKLNDARGLLSVREGTYEVVTSDDPSGEICGEVVPTWIADANPALTLDQHTSFTDFNRGTVYEKSGDDLAGKCMNSFATKMVSRQLLYTMIENQNCASHYSRLDSNITVNGDILIYNFHKVWADAKIHAPIKAQCVLKLKR